MPDDNNNHSGSWTTWAHHVLRELKRLDACNERLKQNQIDLKIEMSKLQVKSGVWGAAGASIPVLMGVIVWLLTR